MAERTAVMTWLLDSDPAIRWQALRDLAGAPAADVAAARSRVAAEGWGARLLALQAPGGHWGAADDDGWMTTVDALQLLRDLGVDPAGAAARRAVGLVRERITWWQLDGRPFFDGETEACINGRILAAGAYFGENTERLVERLLGEQLADGGWNCHAPPSTRSSFHSTICVLEGLLDYEQARGAVPAVTEARARAEDYLLRRRLFRSLASGDVIDHRWTRFFFPPRWHFDVLRGLDYLRSAGADPAALAAAIGEAVAIVEVRRAGDGRWPLDGVHGEQRVSLDLETGIGVPSRWNTLRALRVLDWYRGCAAHPH